MKLQAWVRGTILLVATFAGGVAAGIGYERQQSARDHRAMSPSSHDALHRLSVELSLDADQRRAISEIFARHQKDIDSTWHALQPHVRAAMDATHHEVLAILKPGQAGKFKQLVGTMHSRGHR
jgi:hypothetical protein